MTQNVQAKIEKYERPMVAWMFLSIAFVLLCAYAYFVNGAITSSVYTESMQSKIIELSSSVGDLEREYLSAKSSIDLDYSLAQGFKQSGGDTIYVTRKAIDALSFNR